MAYVTPESRVIVMMYSHYVNGFLWTDIEKQPTKYLSAMSALDSIVKDRKKKMEGRRGRN